MDLVSFKPSSPGQLIRIEEGCSAFVPDPLPPQIEPCWSLIGNLSAADRALSELAGVARTLPNPHLLINPFIRREAVLSSRIEGTQASFSDLLLFEGAGEQPRDPQHSDVHEVRNYVIALEGGLSLLSELPVCLRLICNVHRMLMSGVRDENLSPGEFRKIQNWIGSKGTPKTDAIYVPPPLPEMNQALDDLEKFLHAPSNLPPLIRLALIHYQFEAIHPFIDGNGRIGRLLITLLLCAEQLLPQPLLYLSAFFERHRQEYYRLLLSVTQTGSWTKWINFFLHGVAEQSLDATKRSRMLLDLWQSYRKTMQASRSSALSLQLVDELFAQPIVTVPRIGKILNVTPRAAQLNIDKLVLAGVLKETTGRQRNRIYIAPEIIKIIEAPQV